jgi:hypothetical protein
MLLIMRLYAGHQAQALKCGSHFIFSNILLGSDWGMAICGNLFQKSKLGNALIIDL